MQLEEVVSGMYTNFKYMFDLERGCKFTAVAFFAIGFELPTLHANYFTFISLET